MNGTKTIHFTMKRTFINRHDVITSTFTGNILVRIIHGTVKHYSTNEKTFFNNTHPCKKLSNVRIESVFIFYLYSSKISWVINHSFDYLTIMTTFFVKTLFYKCSFNYFFTIPFQRPTLHFDQL